MTTAAQRLAALSGLSGASAAEHLRAIASGAAGTAAALLVAYSGLASATAAEHLLVDHAAEARREVVRLSSAIASQVTLASTVA